MLLKIGAGASIQIRGTGGNSYNYGFYQGKEVACGGNECDLNCSPLKTETEYYINGILKKDAKGRFSLVLTNFK